MIQNVLGENINKAYNGGIDYKSIMGINNIHDIVNRQVFIDGNNIEVCI